MAGKPEGWILPWLPGALVILPPPQVMDRVNRLRRRYDPESAAAIPAHVTVTRPFRAEPGPAELARVAAVIRRCRPFEVKFGPLINFLPHPCICFAIEPAGAVLELRRRLHATGLFNSDLAHPRRFVPHMSITDGSPPDAAETERLFRRLQNRVRGGRFACRQLVYTLPDWRYHFKPVLRIPLLGDV